jgi:hypothetical protein
MKKSLQRISYALLFSLAFASCKKSHSRRDDLMGHWQQEGYPSNSINFNSDGTGSQIDPSYGNYTFNWTLADNDNSIVLTDGSTYLDTWKIRDLNSGDFTFQDEYNGYIYTFTR